jgi:hypothetical protein
MRVFEGIILKHEYLQQASLHTDRALACFEKDREKSVWVMVCETIDNSFLIII